MSNLLSHISRLKDGVQIEDDDRITVERAPGGLETLVISGVAPTDSGRYQVMASSAAGKASCAADLVVVDCKFHCRTFFVIILLHLVEAPSPCHPFLSCQVEKSL